ncbi:unnamed protein product [Acanthosepion pharaonis]|uniref:Uncharacterized protein n=1 Tax=Acanthosepion pharaonis TaxID=158019 RepID=A0A812DPD3_ACAPH|nr:unnamed protein product [Sepia pharaonis]
MPQLHYSTILYHDHHTSCPLIHHALSYPLLHHTSAIHYSTMPQLSIHHALSITSCQLSINPPCPQLSITPHHGSPIHQLSIHHASAIHCSTMASAIQALLHHASPPSIQLYYSTMPSYPLLHHGSAIHYSTTLSYPLFHHASGIHYPPYPFSYPLPTMPHPSINPPCLSYPLLHHASAIHYSTMPPLSITPPCPPSIHYSTMASAIHYSTMTQLSITPPCLSYPLLHHASAIHYSTMTQPSITPP